MIKKLLLALVIIAILFFGYSKLTEWKAFNQAYESDTSEVYKDFLNNFPKTNYRTEMEGWMETSKSRNSDDYLNYANAFPNSKFVEKALLKAGDIAWGIALQENSSTVYELYVARYPTHPKVDDAKKQLLLLHQSQIQEVRKAFAEFRDIDGVIWDADNNIPIIFDELTDEDASLTPAEFDDFVIAMKIIGESQDPGVSIEPPSKSFLESIQNLISSDEVPEHQSVRYIPEEIKGTHLGLQLFQADRMLKALSFGKDPITFEPVSSSVSGFKALTYLARNDEDSKSGYYGRIWFKPREVVVKEAGNAIEIERVVMGVESESEYTTPSEFAKFFEEHYQEIANEKPIYKELIRIAKYVAVARWLEDNGHIANLDLSDYQVKSFNTPLQTSSIQGLVKEERSGDYIQQSYLIGGVILDTRNTYNRGENVYIENMPLGSFSKELVKSKPYKMAVSWNFTIEGAKYKAIAIPLKMVKL